MNSFCIMIQQFYWSRIYYLVSKIDMNAKKKKENRNVAVEYKTKIELVIVIFKCIDYLLFQMSFGW